jgi:hypothetical protein
MSQPTSNDREPSRVRDHTELVRAELRSCEAFTEVSRGRWELGGSSGYDAARLSPIEVADYLERLHRNIRRTRPTTASGGSGIHNAA